MSEEYTRCTRCGLRILESKLAQHILDLHNDKEVKLKMETDGNLENTGIGNKEVESLKPAKVAIKSANIEEVGDKGNKKVVCSVKHPDKEEEIKISAVKYAQKDKIKVVGLWVNLDEDKLIRKGSSLATFLVKVGAGNIKELEGKEVDTDLDDKGYLCFKAL